MATAVRVYCVVARTASIQMPALIKCTPVDRVKAKWRHNLPTKLPLVCVNQTILPIAIQCSMCMFMSLNRHCFSEKCVHQVECVELSLKRTKTKSLGTLSVSDSITVVYQTPLAHLSQWANFKMSANLWIDQSIGVCRHSAIGAVMFVCTCSHFTRLCAVRGSHVPTLWPNYLRSLINYIRKN